MTKVLTGGCQCGAVRFRAEAVKLVVLAVVVVDVLNWKGLS